LKADKIAIHYVACLETHCNKQETQLSLRNRASAAYYKEVKYVIKLSAVSEFFYKMHRFE